MDSATVRRLGAQIEAMLIEPMLQPLSVGQDVFGEFGLDLLAGEIARRDARGFGVLLAAALERRA